MYKQEHVTALCIGFENVGNSGGSVTMLLKEAVPFLRAQGAVGERLAGAQACRRFSACEIKAVNLKTVQPRRNIFVFKDHQSKSVVDRCREGAPCVVLPKEGELEAVGELGGRGGRE